MHGGTVKKMNEMDRHGKMTDTILNHHWKEEKLNAGHKKELMEYLNVRETIDKASTGTRRIDAYSIYYLSKFLKDKPFKKATKEDMMQWDRQLKARLKGTTLILYEARVRKFYLYQFNKDRYTDGRQEQRKLDFPKAVKWINVSTNDGDMLPIDEILDEKDIKKLLNACKNTREQVIIVSLLDGGITESELVKMKVRNVGFDKQLGAYFILPKGTRYKTKKRHRKVQLFLIPSSTQYIREYLNHHKFKEIPDAPFVYTESHQKKFKDLNEQQLAEPSVWRIVTQIAKDSGVKKKISPHILRHNSATFCAKRGFNEFMMRERFGWSRSSNMPSYYTSIGSKDTDDYIKKVLGIKEPDEPEDSILQPILCPNCEYENVPTNVVCGRCGMKLNISKEDIGMDATETGLGVQEMIKDPEFMLKMMNVMAKEWAKRQKKE